MVEQIEERMVEPRKENKPLGKGKAKIRCRTELRLAGEKSKVVDIRVVRLAREE